MKMRMCLLLSVWILQACELAAAGAGDVEIAVPAQAPKTVLFAAKELKGFLDASLGADVPLCNVPSERKTSFMLGAELWQAAGFSTNEWSRDVFSIRTRPGRV